MLIREDSMYRDAIILDIGGGRHLVTTCDSCGSIGNKEHDVFQLYPDMVAMFTARVAVMEALSLNAMPTSMIIPISNEPEPTAQIIIDGIKMIVDELDRDIPYLFSTEKNMSTSMTAFGVVVNAISSALLLDMPQLGDNIYMVGIPSVGEEVIKNKNRILNIDTINKLVKQHQIRQIIPAGSGGIMAESNALLSHMRKLYISVNNKKENLTKTSLNFVFTDEDNIMLKQSCGPATAALVFAPYLNTDDISIPITKIGEVDY